MNALFSANAIILGTSISPMSIILLAGLLLVIILVVFFASGGSKGSEKSDLSDKKISPLPKQDSSASHTQPQVTSEKTENKAAQKTTVIISPSSSPAKPNKPLSSVQHPHAKISITEPPDLALEDSLLSKFLKLHDVGNLVPAFPAVANKLLAELNAKDVNLNNLEEHVKMDGAILGALFKRAHSAEYAGARVDGIPDAISRIGLGQFKSLVITFGLQASIDSLRTGGNWNNFWIHSILVGKMAERLHYRHANNTGNEYISGLLHDVGKLVLQKVSPEQYAKVLERMADRQYTSKQAELAVFGFSHNQISAILCKKWGMNDHVCTATLFHHDPASPDLTEEDSLLAASIAVADDLANYCGINIAMLRNVSMEVLEKSHTDLLQSFPVIHPTEIDMEEEIKKIESNIQEMVKA